MTTADVKEYFDPITRRNKMFACAIGFALSGLLAVQIAHNLTTFEIIYLVIAILVGVGFLVGLVRAFRVGITLDDEGVIVHAVTSTKTYRWSELKSARTLERAHHGSNARSMVIPSRNTVERIRIIPMLELTSGKTVQLYGLRIQVSSDDAANWIDDAIQGINDRLKAQRGNAA